MAALEDRMWWYRSLHRHVLFILQRYLVRRPACVLDAGCGTGGLIRRVVREAPGIAVFGLDAWHPACRMARSRGEQPIVQADVAALPIPSSSIDAVLSADVLCQERADPARAAAEFWRCLRPGGIVVLNLPAYGWLSSHHDARVGATRRFTRRSVRALLATAGFSLLFETYWNTLPFPLMVLRRRVFRSRQRASDVHPYPGWLDASLAALMATEHAVIRRGLPLWYGGSVLCVARKDDERTLRT